MYLVSSRLLGSRLGQSRMFGRTTQRCAAFAIERRSKSVLVTGGSQGLGEGIVRRLAADGYAVTIADIDQARGEAVAQDIGQDATATCSFLQVDVTVPEQVEAAVRQVVQAHGTLDALVNNAGAVGPQASYADYDIQEWKRVIDINLNGTFYGLKFGLAQMVQQPTGGNIVNLSSTAGFRGFPNLGPYTASKYAVRGMTQAAAVEYAACNIRVNALAPTACETPMVQAFMEAQGAAVSQEHRDALVAMFTSMNTQPGFPQTTDVAAACAFLLDNDQARLITGHTLSVDAGMLRRTPQPVPDRKPTAVP